jgi:hypothetical protein
MRPLHSFVEKIQTPIFLAVQFFSILHILLPIFCIFNRFIGTMVIVFQNNESKKALRMNEKSHQNQSKYSNSQKSVKKLDTGSTVEIH